MRVYRVQQTGVPEALTRVRCKNENRELQILLEHNHDLLPGEQINPEDPRRWLLIKREMPVPSPSTGSDHWSIDFFFADQDAYPTFVECKRFDDTRSRREIVGQMLEYAANGHHYWEKDSIREYAIKTAALRGSNIDSALADLRPADVDNADLFFERMQENLRQGQLRLIFFLEEAPFELRSIVDFLNRQMELCEVLLVEARQFDCGGDRIVVPSLFGYTEQARMIKRRVTVERTSELPSQCDRETLLQQAQSQLSASESQAVQQTLDRAIALGYKVDWGKGKSCAYKLSLPNQGSLFHINSKGELWLTAKSSTGSVSQQISQAFDISVEEQDWFLIRRDVWVPKCDKFLSVLASLVS
jgi:hypothetical protein